MKKLTFLLLALLAGGVINAKTLRVNNNPGAMAPYTTAKAALEAAADGDVIILEGSTTSYGDFDVTKAVTIQGNGYFLDVNGIGNEGASPAKVGTINIKAENVKITSLSGYGIDIYGSHNIVTRCNFTRISLGKEYSTEGTVSDCIIHQNFLRWISGGSYLSKKVSQIQITNNILINGDKTITNVENSVIRYNTFSGYSDQYSALWGIDNSVIEYNFNGGVNFSGSTNTYLGNVSNESGVLKTTAQIENDKAVKETVEMYAGNSGAFAGDDPYVMSGVAAGPRIDDLTVPASVEQGQDLKVTVKIGRSK